MMATSAELDQRARARAQYDAFLAACPSRQLLERISNKWVVLILCALGEADDTGPDTPQEPRRMRYSELARRLSGVSPKMLTQTLRALERDGFVTRTVTPTVPVTVTYAATDLGRSLHQLCLGMRQWAQEHMDDVLAHREEYDGAAT